MPPLLVLLMLDDCHPQVWFVLHKKADKNRTHSSSLILAFFIAKLLIFYRKEGWMGCSRAALLEQLCDIAMADAALDHLLLIGSHTHQMVMVHCSLHTRQTSHSHIKKSRGKKINEI